MSILKRKDVYKSDQWNLDSLFSSVELWENSCVQIEEKAKELVSFKGRLGESIETFRTFLELYNCISSDIERVYYFAMLKNTEDISNAENQGRYSKVLSLYSKISATTSFMNPEILSIETETINEFLIHDSLKEYSVQLNEILRYKKHILSPKEETLIASFGEVLGGASKVFSALTNVDMKFDKILVDGEEQDITHGSLMGFLINPDRTVRKEAYFSFLNEFDKHKHTLAETYINSVKTDVIQAKVRNYPSAIEKSLFADNVPLSVYDNLIETVHNNLDVLHQYYALKQKVLKLDDLHLYDTKVPLIADIKLEHTFEKAVDLCLDSLEILGDEYCSTLKKGLLGGWVDRYENVGKRSGAFSAGSFQGDPYILLNYKEDVFDSVFTLTHEAGHSMHSYYSVKNNPFQHYNYTIFVAEVASTFNEDLLFRHMLKTTEDKDLKAYLINKKIDDTIGTLFRQTMFAEFEKITHAKVEAGEALTVGNVREVYKKLLQLYFGKGVVLDDICDLEGLRVPHFYNAFYVYKYATGLSASMALSEKVTSGGEKELADYLNFLKLGGSKFPLDELKDAGVDMTSPEPISIALGQFKSWVDELESILK